MNNFLKSYCQYGSKVLIATLLLFGSISYAQAAINYLILDAVATSTAFGGSTASISVRIANSCPLKAGSGVGYGYYGGPASATMFYTFVNDSSGVQPNQSSAGTACIAGVPNSLTMTAAGVLNLPAITLTLGSAAQVLSSYSMSINYYQLVGVGIRLPDGSIISATGYYQPGWAHGTKFQRSFQTNEATDINGVIVTGTDGASASIANYMLGY